MLKSPLNRKKVVLIDDQLSVRELLGLFFRQQAPECEVAGEASGAAEALNLMKMLRPSVIVTDVFLKDMAILSFVTEVRTQFPDTKIIAFCRWLDPVIARRLISVGVHGIAAKEDSLTRLRAALVAVLNGGCYVPASIEASLYAQLSEHKNLTDRETEVLSLIAEGFATKEVGDKLSISVKTAEKYREKIMAKLKIHDAVHLTRYAIRNGFAAL